MRSVRTPRARRYGVALIFLLLGTLAGAWHNRVGERGQPDLVSSGVRGMVAPPANVLSKVSRWLGNQTGWLFRGHALAEENRQLKTELMRLQGENIRLREASIDYERLRADLGFVHAARRPLLAADVIARRPNPNFDTLMISRGSRDGVRPHSVVVTLNGLVGQVSEVTPTTASVVMLTDQNSSVGARVQRGSSRVTGVCKGDNSPLVPMIYLPTSADIKRGDVIVTSGLGGVYPAGLPVGKVQEVKADAVNIEKRARVRPIVDLERLEEVYVLP